MGVGVSTVLIRFINFITMMFGLVMVGFGIWLSSHHDTCRASLTLPIMGLGAFVFLISIIGFLGALKNITFLLWIYMALFCIVLVAIVASTALMLIITNAGSGHYIMGSRYKEYRLGDYNPWLVKQVKNPHNWMQLRSCFVKSGHCNNLHLMYRTLKAYKSAELTAIESGCCRPPLECGYPAVNASYFDLTFPSATPNLNDCRLYKNSNSVKCYNCDSCKAGVTQFIRSQGRIVALFSIGLFSILLLVYSMGCCAAQNSRRKRLSVDKS